MGFKRTSEGRVFFQGEDGTANDQLTQTDTQKGQYTQLQILTLLKGLNDKLKTTQAERNQMRKELARYREVIEALEDKADKNERAYVKLAQKIETTGKTPASHEGRTVQAEKIARETLSELEETRKLILSLEEKTERADKTVSALKDMQQEQAQRMAKTVAGYSQLTKRLQESEERQEDLGGRIEEAISQQARLVRKIDKSIEDRARFMRKIERIEETVIQTRDSLNAKAMVLLTDQNASAQVALEDPDSLSASRRADEPLLLDNAMAADAASTGKLSIQAQALGALGIAVVCVLAGWWISDMQKPSLPDLSAIDSQILSQVGIETAPPPPEIPQQHAQSQPQNEWQVEQDTSRFTQTAPPEAEAPAAYQPPEMDMGNVDDIGTVTLQNDQDLLTALGEDVDALAAQLNEIEPGSNQQIIQEPPAEAPAVQQDEAAEIETALADTQPTLAPLPAPTTDFKAEAPRGNGIPGSVNPDPSLSGQIKTIEEQAFQGVPEAQHDLAAVYTAGHAGVRQDYSRAAYWFKQAADQGIANAAYNLGVLNHQGLGMKGDMDEAIRWYMKAGELGHPEAQYNLGIAFIEGIGVPYDPARAANYFKNAADQGIREAAYNLGLIYENGLLGAPQPDSALVWYKTAADAGSPEAKAALEQLAKTLGIKIEDVNKLAESMKGASAAAVLKPVEETAKAAPPPAAAPVSYEPAPVEAEQLSAEITADPVEDTSYSAQNQEQAMVAQIQEYLMRLGLYPGPADGVSGALTSDAIRSYQSLNKLTVDGEPSQEVLSHMLANAAGGNWDGNAGDLGSRLQ